MDDVRRLGAPVLMGLAGSLVALVGALAPFSPAVSHTERGWFLGVPWPSIGADASTVVAAALFWLGLSLMVRAWVVIMRAVRGSGAGMVRPLMITFLLWSAPLVIAPPLLTRDMPSYAAQGEMYSQGFDPYLHSPSVLGGGEFLREVDPLWREAASPYGPVWMLVARAAANVGGHRLLPTMVLLKLAAFAGCLLMAVFLPRLARASGHSPSEAVAFVLLNPIVVVHLAGGGHNEALMLGFLCAGLTFALEGRPLLGVAACVLGGAVKLPALAGAAFIAWWSAGSSGSTPVRVRRVALGAAVAVGTLGAVTLIAGVSWRWLVLITTPTTVQSYISPVTTVGLGLGRLLGVAGVPRDGFLTAWQAGFIGLAILIAVWTLLRVGRIGLSRALGIGLLAVALLSPVLFPFYALWGLVPLAAAGLRRLRVAAIVGSVALTVTLLPGAADLGHAVGRLSPLWPIVVVLVVLAPWLPRHLHRPHTVRVAVSHGSGPPGRG